MIYARISSAFDARMQCCSRDQLTQVRVETKRVAQAQLCLNGSLEMIILFLLHMEKVLGWPKIRYEGRTALQDYALFLHGCCNAMADLQYMQELDM